MLLRRDGRGVLAIGQSSHAWLSGQLARAWGNESFPGPEPGEEVCLAAEQHDVGMSDWDLAPTFNPQTGLPHSFLEMAIETHLRLWTAAPARVLSQSPYAALLISKHGERLYRRRNLAELPEPEAAAIREYLERQELFQQQLRARLEGHPGLREGRFERNSQLLWTWDYVSLGLCLGWRPGTAKDVPVAGGVVDLDLVDVDDGPTVALDPWPLGAERLKLRCAARRLEQRYADPSAMQAALSAARWELVEFELVRGR